MKTVKIKLYQFSELSDEAKERVLNKFSNINTFFEWWDYIYEDAKEIGFKITSFDLYRGTMTGEEIRGADEIALNILNNYGKTCKTYKLAESFFDNWQPIYNKFSELLEKDECTIEIEHELIEIEADFIKDLLKEYLSLLRQEYDYLTSQEAIIDAIEANEYDFTETGKLFYINS